MPVVFIISGFRYTTIKSFVIFLSINKEISLLLAFGIRPLLLFFKSIYMQKESCTALEEKMLATTEPPTHSPTIIKAQQPLSDARDVTASCSRPEIKKEKKIPANYVAIVPTYPRAHPLVRSSAHHHHGLAATYQINPSPLPRPDQTPRVSSFSPPPSPPPFSRGRH